MTYPIPFEESLTGLVEKLRATADGIPKERAEAFKEISKDALRYHQAISAVIDKVGIESPEYDVHEFRNGMSWVENYTHLKRQLVDTCGYQLWRLTAQRFDGKSFTPEQIAYKESGEGREHFQVHDEYPTFFKAGDQRKLADQLKTEIEAFKEQPLIQLYMDRMWPEVYNRVIGMLDEEYAKLKAEQE